FSKNRLVVAANEHVEFKRMRGSHPNADDQLTEQSDRVGNDPGRSTRHARSMPQARYLMCVFFHCPMKKSALRHTSRWCVTSVLASRQAVLLARRVRASYDGVTRVNRR